MNYVERIGKGSFIILVFAFLATIIGYVFRVFLSRSLSVEEFGDSAVKLAKSMNPLIKSIIDLPYTYLNSTIDKIGLGGAITVYAKKISDL